MSSSVYFSYKHLCLYGCSHDTVCVRADTRGLNRLHLHLLKCIHMKHRLTFHSHLKPWLPDILLSVAGDILPLFPLEDYIIPLLSPLISLSNKSSSFLLWSTPAPLFSCSIYCIPFPSYLVVSTTAITLKATGTVRNRGRNKRAVRSGTLRERCEEKEMSEGTDS